MKKPVRIDINNAELIRARKVNEETGQEDVPGYIEGLGEVNFHFGSPPDDDALDSDEE